MRISDWSSDVCSSDLQFACRPSAAARAARPQHPDGKTNSPMTVAESAAMTPVPATPPGATAALVLADGTVFWGCGVGATGSAVGEVCFNTAITGYQEIRSEEHTSELQSLMRISYAVFCLKKKK